MRAHTCKYHRNPYDPRRSKPRGENKNGTSDAQSNENQTPLTCSKFPNSPGAHSSCAGSTRASAGRAARARTRCRGSGRPRWRRSGRGSTCRPQAFDIDTLNLHYWSRCREQIKWRLSVCFFLSVSPCLRHLSVLPYHTDPHPPLVRAAGINQHCRHTDQTDCSCGLTPRAQGCKSLACSQNAGNVEFMVDMSHVVLFGLN